MYCRIPTINIGVGNYPDGDITHVTTSCRKIRTAGTEKSRQRDRHHSSFPLTMAAGRLFPVLSCWKFFLLSLLTQI